RNTSRFAASMARTSAGKYCSPLRSKVSRFPPTSRMASGTLDLGAHRQVVGEQRPGPAAVHLRASDAETAHVDAVQAQDGQQAREGTCRATMVRERDLGHAEALFQDGRGAMAPVVEVAGDDDRQAAAGELLEAARDGLELARAPALVQRQMHAHA